MYEIIAKAIRSKQLGTDHFKATYVSANVLIGFVCGFPSDQHHTDTLLIQNSVTINNNNISILLCKQMQYSVYTFKPLIKNVP